MKPYLQTTPFTTAASSLLAVLHHLNPETKLSRENEFHIWRKTVLLPTRASSIYALAIVAKKHNLDPKIIVEKKEYDFPDYRFHRYKKTEIEQANFSSQLYLKKAQQLNISVQEKSFTLTDIKNELQQKNIILLRINAGPLREEKNTSQYIVIYGYKDNQFQIVDPVVGNLSISESKLQEAFSTLETKKYRDHRMIVFNH